MGKIGVYLSPSKLTNLLATLIVFLSATQFGFHFWPLSSLVYGIRIDYLSPTIYFVDLLIIIYLFLKQPLAKNMQMNWIIGAIPIFFINLLYSGNPLTTLFWFMHFLLYYFFAIYLDKKYLFITLLIAIIFQTILGVIQTTFGHSVGGLMYLLGERMVSVGSPGIALGSIMGNVALRAYGTFSHPNTMAGWLIISFLICIKVIRPINSLIKNRLLGLSAVFVAVGTIIAESRAALISLFGIIIPFYLLKKSWIRIAYFIAIVLTVFGNPTILAPNRSGLSNTERLGLQRVSINTLRVFPAFGTGANASISTYSITAPATRILQPDHNSLTLLLSWLGIFGVVALFKSFSLKGIKNLIVDLIPLVPIILFDHYLLTSPQGLFIVVIYLKILNSEQLSRTA